MRNSIGKLRRIQALPKDHAETEGLADAALKDIPAAIVEANSTDVDSITNATVTSDAIKAAVKDALSK